MNKTAAMQTIRLNLNGKTVEVLADPAKRLSDLLRDDLGLTGTKIGCHSGDCGACTVLLDGQQICSCITAAAQCAGREVTTVEGLACDGKISRLQQAFLAHGASQCGICTPGMLMAAADVLRRHPEPTEQQVQDGLAGVLCRCTGYRKIIEAVLAVAHGDFDLPQPAAGQAVGARLARLDGQAKITGAEKFGADQYPADSLWLRTVRSPHARATSRWGIWRLSSAVIRKWSLSSAPPMCRKTVSPSSLNPRISRYLPTAMCACAARRCCSSSATWTR